MVKDSSDFDDIILHRDSVSTKPAATVVRHGKNTNTNINVDTNINPSLASGILNSSSSTTKSTTSRSSQSSDLSDEKICISQQPLIRSTIIERQNNKDLVNDEKKRNVPKKETTKKVSLFKSKLLGKKEASEVSRKDGKLSFGEQASYTAYNPSMLEGSFPMPVHRDDTNAVSLGRRPHKKTDKKVTSMEQNNRDNDEDSYFTRDDTDRIPIEIQEDNIRRIQNMSETDLKEALTEISAFVNPKLIAQIQQRNRQRKVSPQSITKKETDKENGESKDFYQENNPTEATGPTCETNFEESSKISDHNPSYTGNTKKKENWRKKLLSYRLDTDEAIERAVREVLPIYEKRKLLWKYPDLLDDVKGEAQLTNDIKRKREQMLSIATPPVRIDFDGNIIVKKEDKEKNSNFNKQSSDLKSIDKDKIQEENRENEEEQKEEMKDLLDSLNYIPTPENLYHNPFKENGLTLIHLVDLCRSADNSQRMVSFRILSNFLHNYQYKGKYLESLSLTGSVNLPKLLPILIVQGLQDKQLTVRIYALRALKYFILSPKEELERKLISSCLDGYAVLPPTKPLHLSPYKKKSEVFLFRPQKPSEKDKKEGKPESKKKRQNKRSENERQGEAPEYDVDFDSDNDSSLRSDKSKAELLEEEDAEFEEEEDGLILLHRASRKCFKDPIAGFFHMGVLQYLIVLLSEINLKSLNSDSSLLKFQKSENRRKTHEITRAESVSPSNYLNISSILDLLDIVKVFLRRSNKVMRFLMLQSILKENKSIKSKSEEVKETESKVDPEKTYGALLIKSLYSLLLELLTFITVEEDLNERSSYSKTCNKSTKDEITSIDKNRLTMKLLEVLLASIEADNSALEFLLTSEELPLFLLFTPLTFDVIRQKMAFSDCENETYNDRNSVSARSEVDIIEIKILILHIWRALLVYGKGIEYFSVVVESFGGELVNCITSSELYSTCNKLDSGGRILSSFYECMHWVCQIVKQNLYELKVLEEEQLSLLKRSEEEEMTEALRKENTEQLAEKKGSTNSPDSNSMMIQTEKSTYYHSEEYKVYIQLQQEMERTMLTLNTFVEPIFDSLFLSCQWEKKSIGTDGVELDHMGIADSIASIVKSGKDYLQKTSFSALNLLSAYLELPLLKSDTQSEFAVGNRTPKFERNENFLQMIIFLVCNHESNDSVKSLNNFIAWTLPSSVQYDPKIENFGSKNAIDYILHRIKEYMLPVPSNRNESSIQEVAFCVESEIEVIKAMNTISLLQYLSVILDLFQLAERQLLNFNLGDSLTKGSFYTMLYQISKRVAQDMNVLLNYILTGKNHDESTSQIMLSSLSSPKVNMLDGFTSPLILTLQHYMVKLEVSSIECMTLCLEKGVKLNDVDTSNVRLNDEDLNNYTSITIRNHWLSIVSHCTYGDEWISIKAVQKSLGDYKRLMNMLSNIILDKNLKTHQNLLFGSAFENELVDMEGTDATDRDSENEKQNIKTRERKVRFEDDVIEMDSRNRLKENQKLSSRKRLQSCERKVDTLLIFPSGNLSKSMLPLPPHWPLLTFLSKGEGVDTQLLLSEALQLLSENTIKLSGGPVINNSHQIQELNYFRSTNPTLILLSLFCVAFYPSSVTDNIPMETYYSLIKFFVYRSWNPSTQVEQRKMISLPTLVMIEDALNVIDNIPTSTCTSYLNTDAHLEASVNVDFQKIVPFVNELYRQITTKLFGNPLFCNILKLFLATEFPSQLRTVLWENLYNDGNALQLLDEIDPNNAIDNLHLQSENCDSSQVEMWKEDERVVLMTPQYPCYYYPYDKEEALIDQYIKSLTCKTAPTDPIKGGELVYIAIHHTVHYFRSACLSVLEKDTEHDRNSTSELETDGDKIQLKWGDHKRLMKIVKDTPNETLKSFINYLLYPDLVSSNQATEGNRFASNQNWLIFIKEGISTVNQKLQVASDSNISWTEHSNKKLIDLMLHLDETMKSDRVKHHLNLK